MRNNAVVPGSLRVLIVDDEPSICSAMVQVLRRGGFDPVCAPGAHEADALLSSSIAALLLDLRMPDMRGDAFYHLAAARFPHLRAKTLFMTGDISPDAERMIAQTGCPCLWKPFPNAVLVDALREMLDIQQAAVPAL
jgi:CheY-like chemotaxis protein